MRDDERREDCDFQAMLEIAVKLDAVSKADWRELRGIVERMIVRAQTSPRAKAAPMAIHSPGEPAVMGTGDR